MPAAAWAWWANIDRFNQFGIIRWWRDVEQPTGDQISNVISGNAFKSSDYVVSGGTALIRIGDIVSGEIDLNGATQLPSIFEVEHKRFNVMKDDILVALSGATTGKSGLYSHDESALLNQRVARIRLARPEGRDAEYVRRFIELRSAQILEAAYGAAQPNISHNRLKELKLSWPSSGKRQQRQNVLFSALARADRLEAEAAHARALLDRLEAAILARAFRGKLVPQDPADEPASTLLSRIRAERAAVPKANRGRKAKAA